MANPSSVATATVAGQTHLGQVLLACVVMLAISSPHYTRVVFSTPLLQQLEVKVSQLPATMTIFSI